jgi:hypothetical protein
MRQRNERGKKRDGRNADSDKDTKEIKGTKTYFSHRLSWIP